MSNSELAWVVVCGFRLEEGCPGLWCGLGCLTGLKGFGEAYLVRSFETDCGLWGFGGFWMSREDSWRVSDCMVGCKFNLRHGTAFVLGHHAIVQWPLLTLKHRNELEI